MKARLYPTLCKEVSQVVKLGGNLQEESKGQETHGLSSEKSSHKGNRTGTKSDYKARPYTRYAAT